MTDTKAGVPTESRPTICKGSYEYDKEAQKYSDVCSLCGIHSDQHPEEITLEDSARQICASLGILPALSDELAPVMEELQKFAKHYAASSSLLPVRPIVCTRGPHQLQKVCPDAFGVPCSPPEGLPVGRQLEPAHSSPEVVDYATGVQGSYTIRRIFEWGPSRLATAEFWNPSGWSASGYVINDRKLADAICNLVNGFPVGENCQASNPQDSPPIDNFSYKLGYRNGMSDANYNPASRPPLKSLRDIYNLHPDVPERDRCGICGTEWTATIRKCPKCQDVAGLPVGESLDRHSSHTAGICCCASDNGCQSYCCGLKAEPLGETRQQIDKAFEGMATDEAYQREAARVRGESTRWISVEEKLPELTPYLPYANCHGSGPVLIWLTDESCAVAAFCEKNDGERWWEIDCPATWADRDDEHLIKLDKVTHWQPLPEPPGLGESREPLPKTEVGTQEKP